MVTASYKAVFLVVMMIRSDGYYQNVRPIQGYGYYNLTFCFEFVKELKRVQGPINEIVDISCYRYGLHETWPE